MRYWLLIPILVVLLAGCKTQIATRAPAPVLKSTIAGVQANAQTAHDAAEKADQKVVKAEEGVREVGAAIEQGAATLRQTAPAAEPVARSLDSQVSRLEDEIAPDLRAAHEALSGTVDPALHALTGKLVDELRQADAALAALAKDRDALAVQLADTQKALEAEKERWRTGARWLLYGLLAAGVLAIAGGVFLAVKADVKSGLGLALGGLCTAGAAAFCIQFWAWLAWGFGVAAVGILLAIGAIIYSRWRSGQLALDNAKAAEVFKSYVPPDILSNVKADLKTVMGEFQQWWVGKQKDAGVIVPAEPK
jgi:hypothetical protein